MRSSLIIDVLSNTKHSWAFYFWTSIVGLGSDPGYGHGLGPGYGLGLKWIFNDKRTKQMWKRDDKNSIKVEKLRGSPWRSLLLYLLLSLLVSLSLISTDSHFSHSSLPILLRYLIKPNGFVCSYSSNFEGVLCSLQ